MDKALPYPRRNSLSPGREGASRRASRTKINMMPARTIALLFAGYAACYYCRADLSVATPLLVEELGRRGIIHGEAVVHIGSITSLGVFAYAMGKLFLTGLGDYWGGRRNFLIGVGGATVFTATDGQLEMAFQAWLPGAVGYPHPRLLFIRPLTVVDDLPRVGPPS